MPKPEIHELVFPCAPHLLMLVDMQAMPISSLEFWHSSGMTRSAVISIFQRLSTLIYTDSLNALMDGSFRKSL